MSSSGCGVFAVVFGATTPAVSATLVAIFLGFAAGSAVLGSRAARFSNPLRAYGLLEIGSGLGALLVEPVLQFYDLNYPALYGGTPSRFPLNNPTLIGALFHGNHPRFVRLLNFGARYDHCCYASFRRHFPRGYFLGIRCIFHDHPEPAGCDRFASVG